MGKRGPAPTPEPLNELRGHPGRRPGKSQAGFPSGPVMCPDWLGDIGQAKFQELVTKLEPVDGLLKPVFEDALALYCEAFEELLEAKAEIAKEGATCTSDKGGAYQHPAVGRKNKAIQRMKQFGALFGMSPVAESEINLSGGASDEEMDPLIELMNSRSFN